MTFGGSRGQPGDKRDEMTLTIQKTAMAMACAVMATFCVLIFATSAAWAASAPTVPSQTRIDELLNSHKQFFIVQDRAREKRKALRMAMDADDARYGNTRQSTFCSYGQPYAAEVRQMEVHYNIMQRFIRDYPSDAMSIELLESQSYFQKSMKANKDYAQIIQNECGR